MVVMHLFVTAKHQHEQIRAFRLGNESWDRVTTDVNRPGIIVNHDYPFRYYSGGHWLWDIVFNSSSFVNLILFNVSFNQNPNKVIYIVQSKYRRQQGKSYQKRGVESHDFRGLKMADACQNHSIQVGFI